MAGKRQVCNVFFVSNAASISKLGIGKSSILIIEFMKEQGK
jgi:hypothetical protein